MRYWAKRVWLHSSVTSCSPKTVVWHWHRGIFYPGVQLYNRTIWHSLRQLSLLFFSCRLTKSLRFRGVYEVVACAQMPPNWMCANKRLNFFFFLFFLNSSLKRHYWCSLRRLMPCRGRAASEQSFVGSIWGFYHSATVPAGIQELKSSGGRLSKTASNYKTRNSWDVRCTRASQNNSTNNGHI